jgi:predicted CXXCH cytochrome family protein
VERHDGAGPAAKGSPTIDYTIVNPAHLSRDLAEAICQQCHVSPSLAVAARGRKLADFRPGLRLQDFWHVYIPEGADQTMTVTGHVEQMHLSRCYQKSSTLTCMTCHDPHDEPRPEKQVAYYRSICLGCHMPERCTVDARRRQKESPDNDCVHCHMPRSPTEIPHLAFTHHRIGIHDRPPAGGKHPSAATRLRPFLDLSHLSDIDRKRSLGLGYMALSLREKDSAVVAQHQKQALKLLSEVREAGLREPLLDASLAQLCFDLGSGDALSYAESALGSQGLAGQDRCNALQVLAEEQIRQGYHAGALEPLRELMRLRRHPLDSLHLATCQKALGDESIADESLERAVGINPRLWNVHRHLAQRYALRGDAGRSDWHQRRALP